MKSFVMALIVAGLASVASGCVGSHDRLTKPSAVAASNPDSTAAWHVLDSNADGVLATDELTAQRAMGLLQDFPNADADRDGRVSRTEWDALWPRLTHTSPSPTMVRLNGTNDQAHVD